MLVLFTHFCKSRDGKEKSTRTLIEVTEAQKEASVPLLDLMPNYQNMAHKERYSYFPSSVLGKFNPLSYPLTVPEVINIPLPASVLL